ncbi:hypothetical protein ABTX81_24125 [Kitasatospora sp. NPDC097605]|uniref:hypothetical protein n=1 Tax=Kitasatospora sp. NPDC097605 TaxID=3157226 RepID=UPI0033303C0E
MIAADIPVAVVSRPLRHSTLAVTCRIVLDVEDRDGYAAGRWAVEAATSLVTELRPGAAAAAHLLPHTPLLAWTADSFGAGGPRFTPRCRSAAAPRYPDRPRRPAGSVPPGFDRGREVEAGADRGDCQSSTEGDWRADRIRSASTDGMSA